MQIQVNQDKSTLIQEEQDVVNSGAIDYYKIDITFDSSWDSLIKKVILISHDSQEGEAIFVINNKISIDSKHFGTYYIGIVGYKVEYILTTDTGIDLNKKYYTRSEIEGSYVYTEVLNPILANISTYYETKKSRQISTNLESIYINRGAGEIECVEHEIPSISEWEIYIAQIQEMISGIEENTDHSLLDNLDFAHSGHIGFASSEDIEELDNNKVNKETGKGLSTNDYTTTEKEKLEGIEIGAEVNSVNSVNGQTGTVVIFIPIKISDLSNDSGFISNSVNNLINYYLKSETYTKQEVNTLIGQIQNATIQIVQTLPVTGQSNIMYFVPKTGSTNDVYDEYIWINNNWEHIGNTQVDLTGYATETWVNQRIANFLTQTQIETLINTLLNKYYTKLEVDEALNNKQNTTALVGTNDNPINLNELIDVGCYQLSGVVQNCPAILSNYADVKININVSSSINIEGINVISQKIDVGTSAISRNINIIEGTAVAENWVLKDFLANDDIIGDNGIIVSVNEDDNIVITPNTTILATVQFVEGLVGNINTALDNISGEVV